MSAQKLTLDRARQVIEKHKRKRMTFVERLRDRILTLCIFRRLRNVETHSMGLSSMLIELLESLRQCHECGGITAIAKPREVDGKTVFFCKWCVARVDAAFHKKTRKKGTEK